MIWKFFSNPIICLDGDESGQRAAYRIAERLFPLIEEKNRIYFSIMPDGKDPDDYIKQNGKNGLLYKNNYKKSLFKTLKDYCSLDKNKIFSDKVSLKKNAGKYTENCPNIKPKSTPLSM